MLHDSSGVEESAETRESVMKKRRVNDDMEISAIETLANAKLEADRALHTANKTLHRLLDECPHEFEAITKDAELNSIKDKRVYTEMYKSEADGKIISGKWVLKPHKARYVLRGFERDVKDEDVFLRQHDDDSLSENGTLTSNRPHNLRVHSVHCRRENRLPQRAHEGRRRGVRKTTTRVATGDTGPQQRHSDLENCRKVCAVCEAYSTWTI